MKNNQFTSLIEDKFVQIENSLKTLLPIRRQKRWNTIGTVWKIIAGTPDANDLAMINSSINNLVENNNAQLKINLELNQHMKELTFRTKESILLFNSKSAEIHAIKIFLNLKYLAEKLENIVDSIKLAKVGILNEKIQSTNEIKTFIKDLTNENI